VFAGLCPCLRARGRWILSGVHHEPPHETLWGGGQPYALLYEGFDAYGRAEDVQLLVPSARGRWAPRLIFGRGRSFCHAARVGSRAGRSLTYINRPVHASLPIAMLRLGA